MTKGHQLIISRGLTTSVRWKRPLSIISGRAQQLWETLFCKKFCRTAIMCFLLGKSYSKNTYTCHQLLHCELPHKYLLPKLGRAYLKVSTIIPCFPLIMRQQWLS